MLRHCSISGYEEFITHPLNNNSSFTFIVTTQNMSSPFKNSFEASISQPLRISMLKKFKKEALCFDYFLKRSL